MRKRTANTTPHDDYTEEARRLRMRRCCLGLALVDVAIKIPWGDVSESYDLATTQPPLRVREYPIRIMTLQARQNLHCRNLNWEDTVYDTTHVVGREDDLEKRQ